MNSFKTAKNQALHDIKAIGEQPLIHYNKLIKHADRIISEKDINFNFSKYETT